VGSDYNLLLVSRFKEEIHAGINTGIIRSMGGTGSVVTSAGLVFAFTICRCGQQSRRVGQVAPRSSRLVVRHADHPLVHDAVDRGAHGQVVLVAATSAKSARAVAMAATAAPRGRTTAR